MHARSMIAILILSAGCQLIGGGKANLGSAGDVAKAPKRAAATKAKKSADAPKVDDDDPPHVARAIERLDKMEQLIADKKFGEYARESRDFNGTFMFQDGWSGEAKRDKMRQRLDELDAAAFQAFGGRIGPLVGDAKRVTKLDDDAVEAGQDAVEACQRAAGMSTTGRGEAAAKLAEAVAAYEKQLARASKMEPQIFRYYGEVKKGAGTIDVATKLMECEINLVGAATQFDDEYAPETQTKFETEPGCGKLEWLADGVQIGSGKFAPYSRTVGGGQGLEQIPCKKLAKRNAFGKQFADAVKEFVAETELKASDMVIVTAGKPYIEADDDDFRLHRYQKLIAYSKKFRFSKNPCGDGKTFCEAGGSKGAAAFNRLEHALERAAVHAGKDAERCKRHLKEAKSQADWFADFHAKLVKSGEWISGATYKTKKGALLKEKDFLAAFTDKGKQAEQKLDERFCSAASK